MLSDSVPECSQKVLLWASVVSTSTIKTLAQWGHWGMLCTDIKLWTGLIDANCTKFENLKYKAQENSNKSFEVSCSIEYRAPL